jgi:hypothetical protein
MGLDIVDTVLSSFKRVGSRATLGIAAAALAVLIAVGAGALVSGMLSSVSGVLAAILMVVTGAVYIAGAASISVGALRAFDEKDFSKEMFTENILWPFLRMTGSNIVTQAFIFTAFYILAYPLLLGGTAIGAGALLAGGPGLGALGAVAGVALAIAVIVGLYAMAALSLSLPRIAVNDTRLFEGLDESVQSTKGDRPRIIATILPAGIFVAIAAAGIFSGGIPGLAIYLIGVLLAALYYLSLLTELNTRLN